MAGILTWAIGGARALVENGGMFTTPGGRDEVLAQWRRETDPVLDWLVDHLRESLGTRLPLAEVAQRAGERMRRSVSAAEIGKAARELGMMVKTARQGPGTKPLSCILDRDLDDPVQWNVNTRVHRPSDTRG